MVGTAAKVGLVLKAREFSLGFAKWEMSLCHSGSVSSGQLSKESGGDFQGTPIGRAVRLTL